jgi:TonB family protein
MTLALIVYTSLVSALLSIAALTFEQAAAWLRLDRRWIWLAAMMAAPVLTFSVPWRAVPATPSPVASVESSNGVSAAGGWLQDSIGPVFRAATEPSAGRAPEQLNAVVLWLWLAMSGLALARYTGGRFALTRRRRLWTPADLQGHPVLVAPDAGPAIIGCWFTKIVVPTWALKLEAAHIDLLLSHEREHERVRDPLLIHVSQIAIVLMPWNPATWWMGRRLRSAVEMDCDARVLAHRASPVDRVEYSELLIAVAAHTDTGASRLSPALIERPSVLRRRIAAMHATQPRAARTKFAIAAIVAVGLIGTAFTFPVPSLEAQEAPSTASAVPPMLPQTVAAPASDDAAAANLKEAKPVYTSDAMRAKIRGVTEANRHAEAPPTPAPALTAPVIANNLDFVQGTGTAVAGTGQILRLGASRPGSGIQNPVVVTEVKPIYTREALHEEIQGVVQLEAVVDETGAVSDVRVVHSLDAVYGLDQEAIKAARRWLFRPALDRDNKPVPIIITLELEFRLAPLSDGFGDGAVHVGPGIQQPLPLREVKPVYTSDALRAKVQGWVQLEVVVDENGNVTDVRVRRSLDRVHGLDQEALKAARLWLFRPARDGNNNPISVITTLELEFRLH